MKKKDFGTFISDHGAEYRNDVNAGGFSGGRDDNS